MRAKSKVRIRRSTILMVAIAVMLAVCAAHAEISQRDMQVLSHSQLIFIATVRKDGNQSNAAPVWFTVNGKDSILIQTGPKTWKAKRIRRGSPVLVWIGTAGGPAFIGKAEITNDAAVQEKILNDYRDKYWLNRVFGVGPSRGDLAAGRQIAIIIRPVRDLPAGFKSAPGTPAPPLTTPTSAAGKTP
jgi:general stress protein 26